MTAGWTRCWVGCCVLAALAGSPAALAAQDSTTLSVTATVLSKSTCKFSGGAAPITLAFGLVDPSSTSNVVITATRTFTCNGSAPNATFTITANDGSHSVVPGLRRMQHTTNATEFMAYSLSLSPTSATVPKGEVQTLTVTGTLTPADFSNARVGAYSDTVVITLTP